MKIPSLANTASLQQLLLASNCINGIAPPCDYYAVNASGPIDAPNIAAHCNMNYAALAINATLAPLNVTWSGFPTLAAPVGQPANQTLLDCVSNLIAAPNGNQTHADKKESAAQSAALGVGCAAFVASALPDTLALVSIVLKSFDRCRGRRPTPEETRKSAAVFTAVLITLNGGAATSLTYGLTASLSTMWRAGAIGAAGGALLGILYTAAVGVR